MFQDLGVNAVIFGIVAVVVYVGLGLLVLFLAYLLIRTAILRALHSHYKTVRRFESTGEWDPRYQGRGGPSGPPRP
ncbi:hypothetical protein [Frondihabitans australicus]|uniref:Uncharacterized protein n=1 Tax=Frondihabitans australicus TaxID=386892 RepID=A0A495IFJ3_9MICO|nr:hypothetical protein [Frondihabitans australicus]RKR74188.1 hypothetical protein C8E83_1296 [Frondihabitans australicus]